MVQKQLRRLPFHRRRAVTVGAVHVEVITGRLAQLLSGHRLRLCQGRARRGLLNLRDVFEADEPALVAPQGELPTWGGVGAAMEKSGTGSDDPVRVSSPFVAVVAVTAQLRCGTK